MARTMSTWLLQGALVVLPLLSIALGASMLGVGGHVLAFTREHRNDKVPVRDNTGWFPYLVHLDYLPPNFHVTRPVLLLVTGLLSTLVNLAALVLLFKNRKSTTSSNGRKSHFLQPNLSIIALDATGLLFTLAVTIYAWHATHLFPGKNDKPFDGPLESHEGANLHWDAHTLFDPINWNCLIHGFVVGSDNQAQFLKMCREGQALVDLTVPLLIVECATLCLHFVFWKPARVGKAADVTATAGGSAKAGSESYRLDDYAGSLANSNDHKVQI